MKRRKSNDSNISKSWADVNKIFSSESPMQRQQREAGDRVKRAEQLKQQAQDVLTENSGGATGPRSPR